MSPTCLRLDGGTVTLVLVSRDAGLPEILYWGPGLPPDADLDQLVAMAQLAHGHGQLDEQAPLSLLPEGGRGFPGQPGLIGHRPDGTGWVTQFRLAEPLLGSGQTQRVHIQAQCDVAALRYEAWLSLNAETGVLTASACLTNLGAAAFHVNWLSCPVLPADTGATQMIGYHGRWCQEFQPQTVPWLKGAHVRENRLGRTSHEQFPGLVLPGAGSDDMSGPVWGVQLAWSGDHRLVAEELPDGRRQVQLGVQLAPGEALLAPGESLQTPDLVAAFSPDGLSGLAQAFHRHARTDILPDLPAFEPRPVHYNCWEAVYFDHDRETLCEIASAAADLGAELFVLDDGWFQGRTDDQRALGDWRVDRQTYPDGLDPLIDHVRAQGMRFGLWVEPEMVSAESDLARAHPDWRLDVPGLEQITGRAQYMLDLSRAEVRAFLFGALDALLGAYDIAYLKWDMNRTANLAGTRDGQAVGRLQVEGVYQLMDQLRVAHPGVMIETCASGGGRLDLGILRRTGRAWLSDSNDAHERVWIQREACLFFPPEILGAHVGPAPCHTSGRTLSMAFRAGVAATRSMGLELDPRDLNAGDRTCLKEQIARFKSWRGLIAQSRYFRLPETTPGRVGELFLAPEGHRFLLSVAQLSMPASSTAPPLRLPMLPPGRRYRLNGLSSADVPRAANRHDQTGLPALAGEPLSGALLAQMGLTLPNALPDQVWLIEGVADPD